MRTGTIKWFNVTKGYGFITDDDTKEDIFVHFTGVVKNEMCPTRKSKEGDKEYITIKTGDRVEFNVFNGKNGEQAVDVTVFEIAPEVKPTKKKSGNKPNKKKEK